MKNIYLYVIITILSIHTTVSAQDTCSNSFIHEEIMNAAFYGQFVIPQNPGVVNVAKLATDFDVASGKQLTIEGYAASWAFPPSVNKDSLSFAMILHSNSDNNTVGEALDTIAMSLDSITQKGIWVPPGSQQQIPFSWYHLSPTSEYTIVSADKDRKFWIEILLNPPSGKNGFAFWENATVTKPTLQPANFNNNNSGWLAGNTQGMFEELVYIFTATCKDGVTSTENLAGLRTSIYPNPTTGLATIDVPNNMIEKIVVYDLLGAEVKRLRSNQLDLTNLDSGTYIIRALQKDGTMLHSRVVKR